MTIAISMVKAVPGQEKLVYDLLKNLRVRGAYIISLVIMISF